MKCDDGSSQISDQLATDIGIGTVGLLLLVSVVNNIGQYAVMCEILSEKHPNTKILSVKLFQIQKYRVVS